MKLLSLQSFGIEIVHVDLKKCNKVKAIEFDCFKTTLDFVLQHKYDDKHDCEESNLNGKISKLY